MAFSVKIHLQLVAALAWLFYKYNIFFSSSSFILCYFLQWMNQLFIKTILQSFQVTSCVIQKLKKKCGVKSYLIREHSFVMFALALDF